MEGLVSAVGHVLIDVQWVDVAGIPEGDPVLPDPHGVLVQVWDAFGRRGIALFLGSAGIYGVVSYVASQRSAEMGVRLALGADPGRVRNIILSRGMSLAGLGVALGLVASVALGGVLRSLLFGVSPLDLPTLVGASVVFLFVAALSSVIPARRAARTSPAIALRAEG